MHFPLKLSLIFLIIQIALSIPVENKDDNAVKNMPGSETVEGNKEGADKTVLQDLDDYNKFFTDLIQDLTNTLQKVENLNKTERADYELKPDSQAFYDRSKSFLQKLNSCITYALSLTNNLKTYMSSTNFNQMDWFKVQAEIKNIHERIIETLIDIADDNNYFTSLKNSIPMNNKLHDLILELVTIYQKVTDARKEYLLKSGNLDDYDTLYGAEMLNATFNEYVKFLAYTIHKLNITQEKLKINATNEVFNPMIDDYKIKKVPALKYYISSAVNVTQEIFANMMRTSFRGKYLYFYGRDKVSEIRYAVLCNAHMASSADIDTSIKKDLESIESRYWATQMSRTDVVKREVSSKKFLKIYDKKFPKDVFSYAASELSRYSSDNFVFTNASDDAKEKVFEKLVQDLVHKMKKN